MRGNELRITFASVLTLAACGPGTTRCTKTGEGIRVSTIDVGFKGQHGMSFGLAVDAAGYVYMGDYIFNKLWKIAPNTSAIVLAGDGTQGFADGSGGPNGTAEFDGLSGVAADVVGNVYVADGNNNRIRRIAPDGSTTTLAGNGTPGSDDGTGGADGNAEFRDPGGVGVDGAGNIYVADTWNYSIRRIAPNGTTSTVDTFGAVFQPEGVVVDDGGVIYIADYQGGRILKAVPGEGIDGPGCWHQRSRRDLDGPRGLAEFDAPDGISIDGAGNLYVTDVSSDRVRMITPDGTTSTVAGNGAAGYQDGTGGRDGSAEFSYLGALAVNTNRRRDLRVGCRLSAADLQSVRLHKRLPSRRQLRIERSRSRRTRRTPRVRSRSELAPLPCRFSPLSPVRIDTTRWDVRSLLLEADPELPVRGSSAPLGTRPRAADSGDPRVPAQG